MYKHFVSTEITHPTKFSTVRYIILRVLVPLEHFWISKGTTWWTWRMMITGVY